MEAKTRETISTAIETIWRNTADVRPLIVNGIKGFMEGIDSSVLQDILSDVDPISIPIPNNEEHKFEEAEFNVKDLTICEGRLLLSLQIEDYEEIEPQNEDYEEIEINSNLVKVLDLYDIFLALEEYHDTQEELEAEEEEAKAQGHYYRYGRFVEK